MSTGQRQQENGSSTVSKDPSRELGELLDKVLSQSPVSVRTKGIEDALLRGIEKIRRSLPDILKGQAERLVRRAIIYIQMKPALDDCTPQSLIMCVIKAAEMGLPLDGRMCHAVPFNNSYKDDKGGWYKIKEAVPMPDYRGLIAVAKRTGLIDDIYAECVFKGDDFSWERSHEIDVMKHTFDLEADREKVIGVYCKVKPVGAPWRYELMTRKDIEAIRNKSKAKEDGPWKDADSSDWRQMAKKTVLRRVLQGFCEDPGLAAAVDADESEYTLDSAGLVPEVPKRKLSDLTRVIEPEPDVEPEPVRKKAVPRAKKADSAPEQTQQTQEHQEPETHEQALPISRLDECMKVLDEAAMNKIISYAGRDDKSNLIYKLLGNSKLITVGDDVDCDGGIDTMDSDCVQQVLNEIEASKPKRKDLLP